jgi:hypothetical protein
MAVINNIITDASQIGVSGFTADNETAPYLVYDIDCDYFLDTGQRGVPVEDTQGPCDIISLHQPVSMKGVSFHAIRCGKPPDLPDPNPTDTNLTLREAWVRSSNPRLRGDGVTWVYEAVGRYVYIMSKPFTAGGSLPGASAPYSNRSATAADTGIQGSQFKKNILG